MLRDHLKKHEIPWRQVYSGKRWDSLIPQQYGIRNVPSGWLIDKDGTLISQQASRVMLEHLVSEAVPETAKVNLVELMLLILGNNRKSK